MDTFTAKLGASFLTNSKLKVRGNKLPIVQVSIQEEKGSNRVTSEVTSEIRRTEWPIVFPGKCSWTNLINIPKPGVGAGSGGCSFL